MHEPCCLGSNKTSYIYFEMFGSSLTVFCLKRGTKQNRHSQSVAESKNCTVNDVKAVLKIFLW